MCPTSYTAENYTFSPIKSHPQISIGGKEAIPIVASTLMSPLSACLLFVLLIIAFIWFIVKRAWAVEKKSEQLHGEWGGIRNYPSYIVYNIFRTVFFFIKYFI